MSYSSSLILVLQKARFKAVESLREPKSRAIVVATDVAARGLDIPSVATVVHYDVARQVDTFIHRAGRTAVSLMCGCLQRGSYGDEEIYRYRTRVSEHRGSSLNMWKYCFPWLSESCTGGLSIYVAI